jgi:hypothetical protein
MRWLTRAAVVLAILAAFALAFALTPPRGPRSMRQFDPDRLARLEIRVWQAGVNQQPLSHFSLAATLERERYRYSWAMAGVEAWRLERAASAFDRRTDDGGDALSHLESAYEGLRTWTGASFDPHAVARAELAWWRARRVPGNNAESIGALIADEYAQLYDSSRERMAAAALLRAQAMALRDAHAGAPDWSAVTRLLQDAYRELQMALASANV